MWVMSVKDKYTGKMDLIRFGIELTHAEVIDLCMENNADYPDKSHVPVDLDTLTKKTPEGGRAYDHMLEGIPKDQRHLVYPVVDRMVKGKSMRDAILEANRESPHEVYEYLLEQLEEMGFG